MKQTPPSQRAVRLGIDIELRAIRNGGWRFPSHWHDDLQVIATLHGRGEASIDGRTYSLREGGLVVVPPRAVHTARAATGTWSFHSLHVALERLDGASFGEAVLADSDGSVFRWDWNLPRRSS